MRVNLSGWWGEAPIWPYDANEAADVLIPKILLGRKPRRAGVCRAAADKRTVGLTYVSISRVLTKFSCSTQTRGSAHPSALRIR